MSEHQDSVVNKSPMEFVEMVATYGKRLRIDKKFNNELALKYMLKKRNIKRNGFSRKLRNKIYNFIINVPKFYHHLLQPEFPLQSSRQVKCLLYARRPFFIYFI